MPFCSGSISKHLFSLTLPALITILAGMSFILVDTFFVSRLGVIPLAAISFIFPIVFFFQMIAVGLGIAASSIISRLIGANKKNEAKTTIAALFIVALIITICFTPLILIFIGPLFHFIGATNETLPFIKAFMHAWTAGVLFILISYIGSNVLRVHGHAKRSARFALASSGINIVLAPLFIFTFHLGLEGSAIAGVISRVIVTALMLRFIIRNYLPDYKDQLRAALLSLKKYLRQIFTIAAPAILTNAVGPLATLWIIHLLTAYGDGAVTAFGIATRIEMMAVIPLYALSASVGPIIGQNMGARLYKRSYSTLMRSYKYSILWGCVAAVVLYFAGGLFVGIFTKDPNIIHISSLYLSIISLTYASWGIIMMTNANFNSIGKPLRSTWITCLRMGVLLVPLSYFLNHLLAYKGIFIAFALSNLITSIWAMTTAITNWRKISETENDMPTTPITV